jgi:hypothetical protein
MLLPVPVVDMLVMLQGSAKRLLHHVAMLRYPVRIGSRRAPRDLDPHVSTTIGPKRTKRESNIHPHSSALPETRSRTKSHASRSLCMKRLAAVDAIRVLTLSSLPCVRAHLPAEFLDGHRWSEFLLALGADFDREACVLRARPAAPGTETPNAL